MLLELPDVILCEILKSTTDSTLIDGVSERLSEAAGRRAKQALEAEMDQMKLGSGLDLIRRRHAKPNTCKSRKSCR